VRLFCPDAECRNLITALALIRDRRSETGGEGKTVEDPVQKSRLAVVLCTSRACGMEYFVFRLRTGAAQQFRPPVQSWHGDVSDLLPAWTTRPGSTRSLQRFGGISPDAIRRPERQSLVDAMRDVYATASDGASHSAAGWALQRWTFGCLKSVRRRKASPGRNWFVNHHGLTMIAIRPGTFSMGDLKKRRPASSSQCD